MKIIKGAQLAAISAAFALLSSSAASAAARELRISQPANGSELSVSVHPGRHAGAIDSLVYRGTEYVNNFDHGRQIQTAIQVDGLGECLNPTEAGSKADGQKDSTSSVLVAGSDALNVLRTETLAAFWMSPSEHLGRSCGMFRSEERAQNRTIGSRYKIARTTRFYGPDIPNLLIVNVTVTMPERRKSAVIEGLTGYLPAKFTAFYSYDPRSGQRERLSAGTKEHWVTNALIVSTPDGRNAMGLFSPEIWQGDPTRNFYSYFYYPDGDATAKWTLRFGEFDVPAGASFHYSAAIGVGTVDEVSAALSAYARARGLLGVKRR